MNRLRELQRAGVSIWLDTLSRDLLDSGAFAALIAERAVTGATSNPTIFAKAIAGSDRYDDELHAIVASGQRDRNELLFQLALDDVRRAADLLRPAYEASDGFDGFVSFECTPDLADDTRGTVDQALELWARLARPNVMIKVPATDAGIPAIEELTARGVNVNIKAAVLARALRAGDRRLHDRARAADRSRAACRHDGLRRLVLRLPRGLQGRRRVARRLRAARPGRDRQRVDLAAMASELEREGVQAFCASYHELLDCIDAKLRRTVQAVSVPR